MQNFSVGEEFIVNQKDMQLLYNGFNRIEILLRKLSSEDYYSGVAQKQIIFSPSHIQITKEKIDKIAKILICPSCKEVLINPVQNKSCLHTYCEDCFDYFVTFIKSCPNCYDNIEKSNNTDLKEIVNKNSKKLRINKELKINQSLTSLKKENEIISLINNYSILNDTQVMVNDFLLGHKRNRDDANINNDDSPIKTPSLMSNIISFQSNKLNSLVKKDNNIAIVRIIPLLCQSDFSPIKVKLCLPMKTCLNQIALYLQKKLSLDTNGILFLIKINNKYQKFTDYNQSLQNIIDYHTHSYSFILYFASNRLLDSPDDLLLLL